MCHIYFDSVEIKDTTKANTSKFFGLGGFGAILLARIKKYLRTPALTHCVSQLRADIPWVIPTQHFNVNDPF